MYAWGTISIIKLTKELVISMIEINANVYTKTEKGVFLVKVSLPELGMYINSITVRKSIKYPDKGLWVQMPAVPYKGKYIRPLEFSNGSGLKVQIEDAALRAVDAYNHEDLIATADELFTEKPT